MIWVLWLAAASAGAFFRQVLSFQHTLASLASMMANLEAQGVRPIIYQNSITPPWVTWVWFALLAAILVLVGVSSYLNGLTGGGIALAAAFVGCLISGIAIRPNNEAHFDSAFHSLTQRGANYRRSGDTLRAKAAEDFCALMIAVNGAPYGTRETERA